MRTAEKSLKEENEKKNQVPEKLSVGTSTQSPLSALDKWGGWRDRIRYWEVGWVFRGGRARTASGRTFHAKIRSKPKCAWPAPPAAAVLGEQRGRRRLRRIADPALPTGTCHPPQGSSSSWGLVWGTPGTTPGRGQGWWGWSFTGVLLGTKGLAWSSLWKPLWGTSSLLWMAWSISGNRREAPGPLAYIKGPFWAITLGFVARNEACEGRALRVCFVA